MTYPPTNLKAIIKRNRKSKAIARRRPSLSSASRDSALVLTGRQSTKVRHLARVIHRSAAMIATAQWPSAGCPAVQVRGSVGQINDPPLDGGLRFGSDPPECWPDLDEDLGIAGMLQGRPLKAMPLSVAPRRIRLPPW
jgi:hypothetical protein